MIAKAVIFGIKGTRLTPSEKKLLKRSKPWGIIIFSRNIKSLPQLTKLVNEIKKIVKDKKYPILIDQEGGRVSRLNNILDFSLFSQRHFANLYKKNRRVFFKYYKLYIKTTSNILNSVGININTVPVLDVISKKTSKVIGDRSFSKKPIIVGKLGSECIKLFNRNNIGTVMKHIPGHGPASKDTHYFYSVVNKSKKNLVKEDFLPFKKCKSLFAMTAHILYKKYDPNFVATHSKIIINDVIRKHIKFNGLIITDDISMKSLPYSLKKNTTLALKAGCNLILHCNGNIKEMNILSKIVPKVDNFILKKTSQFYKFLI